MKYLTILLILIALGFNNAFAMEPKSVDYFANPEFQIYKINVKQYQFSIPYKLSNGSLEKITVDCDSTSMTANFDKIQSNSTFVINIPRALIDHRFSDGTDDFFITVVDQWEVEYQEIYSDPDSRTLQMTLPPDSKVLEILATNVGMFPEPAPCGTGGNNASHYFKLLSPLQQIKSGIQFHNVKCNDGLVLAQRGSHEKSACVKLDTKIELTIRGWADDDRLLLGCTIDRIKICYPEDQAEYRKALQKYYYGNNTLSQKESFLSNP